MKKIHDLLLLKEEHTTKAGEMLARAFHDYPDINYIFSDIDERNQKLSALFEYMVCYGIKYGEVYSISSKFEAVAVWLPYWKADMKEEKEPKIKFPELGEKFEQKNELIQDCAYRCHKQYAKFSHWYLFPIGVDPIFQGNGYASILLRAKFFEIDKLRTHCYLETSQKTNVSLYQHFGFKVVEHGIVPRTTVPYWAMLRKPT